MPDAFHTFGSDLQLSATGDLLTAAIPTETTQRVLRRLMTNAGGYIWQLAYGAGLPARVGRKANAKAIASLVRSQIFQEGGVAQQPPPVVSVSETTGGMVFCAIQYTDAVTAQPVTLSVPIGP